MKTEIKVHTRKKLICEIGNHEIELNIDSQHRDAIIEIKEDSEILESEIVSTSEIQELHRKLEEIINMESENIENLEL